MMKKTFKTRCIVKCSLNKFVNTEALTIPPRYPEVSPVTAAPLGSYPDIIMEIGNIRSGRDRNRVYQSTINTDVSG